MGSSKNWLDVPRQEKQALAFVVGDGVTMVDVFRRSGQVGVAGLTTETSEQKYIRTSAVRIDQYNSRSSGSAIKPVGLTNDTDVRRDDLWRLTDQTTNLLRWYRVFRVRRTQTTSSVVLEEVKR